MTDYSFRRLVVAITVLVAVCGARASANGIDCTETALNSDRIACENDAIRAYKSRKLSGDETDDIRRRAELGEPRAQQILGLLYEFGLGIPKDTGLAATWYRKAAQQGKATAQEYLGVVYRDGTGVTRDLAQSAAWFRASANQGNPYAQDALGKMYWLGQGVRQDKIEADMWTRKAFDWYLKAANRGYAPAQTDLATLYAEGRGVRQDYGLAATWRRKAAESGDAFAAHDLAYMYFVGQGIQKDYAQAALWYRKSADQGNAESQHNLGILYENGLGVPRDINEATAWYRRAEASGYKVAQISADAGTANPTPPAASQEEELSQHEYDYILAQILPWFKIDTDRREAKGMVLDVVIEIKADGTLASPLNRNDPWNPARVLADYPMISRTGYSFQREAMEAMLSAFRLAQPLKLPPGEKWPRKMHVKLLLDSLPPR